MSTKRMSQRRYDATIKKVRVAYLALEDALATAGWAERSTIARAMDQLPLAVEALQAQVCDRCDGTGSYAEPNNPYTSFTCLHDGVPTVNLRSREGVA